MSKIRRLFTPKDLHGNVVLNFTGSPKDELAALGESYFRAAVSLKEKFLSEKGYSDLDAYPIVFLYRHALELFLKAICNLGNRMAPLLEDEKLRTSDIFRDHSLARNLDTIKRIFVVVGWRDDYDFMGLDAPVFEEIIREFDELDKGSFTFRYTIKKDGSANIDRHFVFSVPEFTTVIEPVLTNLSGACTGLEEYYDQMMDAHHDMMADAYNDMMADAEQDYYDGY